MFELLNGFKLFGSNTKRNGKHMLNGSNSGTVQICSVSSQSRKVRSVADYAAKYGAQNKNSAPKHYHGRSR